MKHLWKGFIVIAVMLAMVIPVATNAVTYTNSVTLENKTGDSDWFVINDSISAILDYNASGATFDFSLTGTVPLASTEYSLIYYADPWPGNFPGALIGTGTSNANNSITITNSVELDIDMPTPPDTNICGDYCTKMCGTHLCNPDAQVCSGAKIWLVVSSDYSASTKSMTVWNPANYLFETDLIIYDDTDILNDDVSMCTNVLEPQICVTVAPNTLSFGSLYPGECEELMSALTVTNCGGINITVDADISGALYVGENRLWLSHGTGWIPAESWTCDITAWQSKVIHIKLCVPVGYQAGTATGSLSFIAAAQQQP